MNLRDGQTHGFTVGYFLARLRRWKILGGNGGGRGHWNGHGVFCGSRRKVVKVLLKVTNSIFSLYVESNSPMNKNVRFIALGIVALTISLCSIGHTDEIVIRHLGKVNAISTNGNVQLELFYVASSTNRMAFDQYWIAKPNSHQALVSARSNNIVDWGDRICEFNTSKTVLSIYPGITNIEDPLSVEDIKQYFTPVFERFHEHKDLDIGMKNLFLEPLLPKSVLGTEPRTFGFHVKINKITVTSTNVTLALQGERPEVPEEDRTNNVALFTFGKDLNLIGTKIITNTPPQTIELH